MPLHVYYRRLYGADVPNTDTDGHNNSHAVFSVCIPNTAFLLAVGMSRDECMPESKVLNANELETACDTAIRLFINSVTKRLATENIIDVQLIDLLGGSMSFNEPVIDGDSNWEGKADSSEALLTELLPSGRRHFSFYRHFGVNW